MIEFERLLKIMDELRAKCPWDKEQTFDSLRHLTIEEMYELSDAILEKDLEEIRKELGDLMLHIVFYAKLGEETGSFGMADVLSGKRQLGKDKTYRRPGISSGRSSDVTSCHG